MTSSTHDKHTTDPRHASPAQPDQAPAHVLVVDDDPVNLSLLATILGTQGYRLTDASTGQTALAAVRGTRPDLVLLDVRLPDIDGYDVCRQLQADDTTCDTPVIFMSALGNAGQKVKRFEAGGVDYVAKPFAPAEVLARVRTHLALRRMHTALAEKNRQLQDELDRKEREEQARARLTTAVEQCPDAIVITDADANITYVNPAFQTITGHRRDEVLGHNPRVLKSGRHPDAFYTELWERLTSGQVWRGRFTNRRKDGTLYEEDAVITPVRDNQGITRSYVAVKRDITRQLAIDARLRQRQRMEAIGTLASGVAHEINNPINGIMNYAQLVVERTDPDAENHTYAREIISESERVATIVRNLLEFSRPESREVSECSVRTIVDTVVCLTRALFVRDDIVLTIDHGNAVPAVMGNTRQLELALMNLVINAHDAIRAKSDETDTARDITVTSDTFARDGETWVRLSVRDTGSGIPEEARESIFDPFFTTRGRHRAAGLGLWVCQTILRRYNGDVRLGRSDASGTAFHLELPGLSDLSAG